MFDSAEQKTVKKIEVQRFTLGWLYDQISGDEDTRVCKDISNDACRSLPRNFFAYLVANVLTKVADELSSARLILPWLLGSLGVPAVFAGFLVPIRESGVLLPQLFVAAYIRRLAKRKYVWLLGGLLSCAALVLMAGTASGLKGTEAGWAIVLLLGVFSLARGLCSVSAKDVLGKTVPKTRRGALMGYAAGISGVLTLLLGLYVEFYAKQSEAVELFPFFLISAALIWLLAIVSFAAIDEEAGETQGGGNAVSLAVKSIGLVKRDPEFRGFITARALLLSVALAPPFYVLLAQENSSSVAGLGLLIIASGLAGSLSAPFWGRMSDRSSRLVMIRASFGAGAIGIAVWVFDMLNLAILKSVWSHFTFFFLIALFHAGVRLGRKVYLVDMSNKSNRSEYVAVSNTIIGVLMLLCGGIGIVGDLIETSAVLGLLGLASALASLWISKIKEVSG